jgi:hypothetical protein
VGRSAWCATATASGWTPRSALIDLLVDEAELVRRRAEWVPPPAHPGSDRGYLKLYIDEVTQADQGCDFDFLRGAQKEDDHEGA